MTDTGQVHLHIEAGVASVRFDRPQARNAMTWAMYEQLMTICRQLREDASVRVATFRGAGGEAFVAGTDIAQFQGFGAGAQGGDDGADYERQIDACIRVIGASYGRTRRVEINVTAVHRKPAAMTIAAATAGPRGSKRT